MINKFIAQVSCLRPSICIGYSIHIRVQYIRHVSHGYVYYIAKDVFCLVVKIKHAAGQVYSCIPA